MMLLPDSSTIFLGDNITKTQRFWCGGSTIEVMGRWKRRHLAVGRDFVEESFTLADGRTLFYKQPEAELLLAKQQHQRYVYTIYIYIYV